MKTFNRYLILSLFLGLFLFSLPKAYAGTCAWGTDLAGLSGCCDTGNNFFSCIQPSGGKNFVMSMSGTLTCKLDTVVKSSYLDVLNAKNWKSFDCADGSFNTSCRDGYCPDGTNTCIARTGVACKASLNRVGICPGGCGGCASGYTYCVNNQPTNIPDELTAIAPATEAGTLTCQVNKDGSTFASNGGKTCAALGKNVANPCTGECTACPDGKTPSGRMLGVCVSYAVRFTEIFEDGFTYFGGKTLNLGGVSVNNAYSYGSFTDVPKSKDPSNAYFYGDVFTEVDQSDNLNWASATVPSVLQSLIANAGYQFCGPGGSCPTVGQICTAGICNLPGGVVACSDAFGNPVSSLCSLGLLCDSTTKTCVNPSNPNGSLVACTVNLDCATQDKGAIYCVSGFCRNQANGLGASCPSGLDAQCAAGLICNASKICVLANDPVAHFVGLSASSNGNPSNPATGSYLNANILCNTAFAGSHMCTAPEVIHSYFYSVPALIGKTGRAWISNGPPGYIKYVVNDCNGWNSVASNIFTGIWDFTNKRFSTTPCNQSIPFACCK